MADYYYEVKPNFSEIPGKTALHIRVPAAFPGSGQDKPSGKNCLDLRGFGRL
jgi:hypothetical protein